MDTVVDGEMGFYISRFSIKVCTNQYRLKLSIFFSQVINLSALFFFQYEEEDPTDVSRTVATLKRAIKVVGTALHKEMIQNCMAQDLSWKVIYTIIPLLEFTNRIYHITFALVS